MAVSIVVVMVMMTLFVIAAATTVSAVHGSRLYVTGTEQEGNAQQGSQSRHTIFHCCCFIMNVAERVPYEKRTNAFLPL